MNSAMPKGVHPQALNELHAILKKPYKDVCNICLGSGSNSKDGNCPKCKGSGHRLLRLM